MNGKKYVGEFQNNLKHGKGVYTYPDGKKYDGMWANGVQDGEGTFSSPEGKKRVGLWKNGKRIQWIDGKGESTMSVTTRLSKYSAASPK